MNARERAGAVIDMFTLDWMVPGENRPPVTIQRIILAIEQAIIAAEEAKAKEERKACAEIAKEVKDTRTGFDETGSYCAALIEGRIRARSEGEKKGE